MMSTPPDPTTPPAPPAGNPQPPGTGPAVPPAPPAPPAPATDPAAPPGGDGDPALGAEGEKALAIWKQRAKEAEKQAKDQAARIKEYEDRDKTEAERQADALKAAQERAAQATRLAVSSQVEALAAGRFQDPQDAVTALQSGSFLADDGTVNRTAITAALDDLLTRKPHWAAAEPGPRIPRPDPSQGPRPGATTGGVDDQIAAAKAKGDWRAVLSLENSKLANVKN